MLQTVSTKQGGDGHLLCLRTAEGSPSKAATAGGSVSC